jgi:two-component system LytT family response regulator
MPAEPWRVLIADDEPAARRGVRQLLAAHPDFRVVAECRNGAEVLRALDEAQPHVVFLDIQMPGVDGFEVIRRRKAERMPAVVFLTAYDEFALAAFSAEALDYLVKPVSEARFGATMKRLSRQLRSETGGSRAPTIAVPSARGTTVLHLDEIEWIESADNYSRLYVGRRSYLIRESLNALERRVTAHGFARAHRTALLRLGAVRELVRGPRDSMIAVLMSGTRISVARRRMAAIGRLVRR